MEKFNSVISYAKTFSDLNFNLLCDSPQTLQLQNRHFGFCPSGQEVNICNPVAIHVVLNHVTDMRTIYLKCLSKVIRECFWFGRGTTYRSRNSDNRIAIFRSDRKIRIIGVICRRSDRDRNAAISHADHLTQGAKIRM